MILEEGLRFDRPGDVDEIFEIFVTSYHQGGRAVPIEEDLSWHPATDVYETSDRFVVQVDLAGMDPAGIELLTDGESLTIRGVRRDIAPPGKKHFFKMEINVGPFARRIAIPVDVVTESAEASYRNGFLYVTFRKGRPASGERRRIDVGGE